MKMNGVKRHRKPSLLNVVVSGFLQGLLVIILAGAMIVGLLVFIPG